MFRPCVSGGCWPATMGCVLTFEAEEALAGAAVRLGAAQVAGWSEAEQRLADAASHPGEGEISQVRSLVLAGEDPLGEAFCRLRGPAQRRSSGQTFTPRPVVQGMVGWAARTLVPARVIDPGTGSARFLAAAGHRWPEAALLGVETDPLAAMIGRATLAAAGLASRSSITLGDYRSLRLAPAIGPTLFLGNPPYVRHHQIPAGWKCWLRSAAAGARHVNIAHGLYPREPLPPAALDVLAAYLRRSVMPGQGRTYAGGLTKFEPGEMERLKVPAPALLPAYAPAALAVPATQP